MGEIPDHLLRQRIGHTQLQERSLREDLARILIRDATGNDAQTCVAHLYPINRISLRELLDLSNTFLNDWMAPARIARHHDILLAVDAILRRFSRLLEFPLTQFDDRV